MWPLSRARPARRSVSAERNQSAGESAGNPFSLISGAWPGAEPLRSWRLAIVNGIAAAPFLVLVMVVANNKTLMGEYRNGRLANVLGWLASALMAASAVAFFLTGGVSGL